MSKIRSFGTDKLSEHETHFGYQKVALKDKQQKVDAVFHSVAEHYDVMNDLMSLGMHRVWKRWVMSLTGIRPGQSILDLAGGTGDLTLLMARQLAGRGQIILSDINDSMLSIGRDRVIDKGDMSLVRYVQADAQHLPFKKNQFDCVTIAFGLRNVPDVQMALESILPTLKPGGRLLVLEFSRPRAAIQAFYDFYSFQFLPRMGAWVANDRASYQYLAESIRMHPDQETLKQMFLQAGYDHCEYHNLSAGIVAAHRGFKY
jgi:demethylmenaquinone methyltransferase / 2-methoxy-6-polyprenyl-1,4-benzoquinol methylase